MAEASPAVSVHNFGGAAPVLRVADLDAALEYYTGVLGFRRNWGDGGFASVSRDRCTIFLCEGDQGHPGTWVWIGVADAVALEKELRAQGARIRNPPTNYPWALEMQVEDPDGNIMRFGSEPIGGQPFGDWLDMNGKRWPMSGRAAAECD
jgi:catechol 2,3-dioxygenase-like lactoylglutathione lyase family enzyme